MVLRASCAFSPISLEHLGGGTHIIALHRAPFSVQHGRQVQHQAAALLMPGFFPHPICSWWGKDPYTRSQGG